MPRNPADARHESPGAPIPLPGPERELLVAAWSRVKDTGRPYVTSPHMPALARIITANRAAGVPAAAIAAALGIERGGCARLLRAYGAHQAEQAWSAWTRIQTGLAALCAPLGVLGLTYGLLTGEYLEVAAGLALFGLAARSLGR